MITREGCRLSIGIFTFFSILICPDLYASAGTEGAAFLEIPAGARPAAMGSAYTALANDAYAPVWNPGALAFLDGIQLAGQHLSYLQSMNDEYVGLALPLGSNQRALAFSGQYLGTGDIAGTDTNGNSTGNFTAHYGAYSMAYGQRLTDKLGVGLNPTSVIPGAK